MDSFSGMEITLLKPEINFFPRLVRYLWERLPFSWCIFIFCLGAVVLMLSVIFFPFQYMRLIGFLHSCVLFIWFEGVVKKKSLMGANFQFNVVSKWKKYCVLYSCFRNTPLPQTDRPAEEFDFSQILGAVNLTWSLSSVGEGRLPAGSALPESLQIASFHLPSRALCPSVPLSYSASVKTRHHAVVEENSNNPSVSSSSSFGHSCNRVKAVRLGFV